MSAFDWEKTLKDRVPIYGHRNWFVVADSAYPAQSRAGIETIVANADQSLVVEKVLAVLRLARHVKPIVYTDQELQFVEERDAPGIKSYRYHLADLLEDFSVSVLAHEEIISKLDRVGETFRVTVIKTNTTMPYTSVFFELDCGYWNADAESRLRAAMKNGSRT
jgi:L-fucose mutarotase/ribose pyranase (RbsD/FucU family)